MNVQVNAYKCQVRKIYANTCRYSPSHVNAIFLKKKKNNSSEHAAPFAHWTPMSTQELYSDQPRVLHHSSPVSPDGLPKKYDG